MILIPIEVANINKMNSLSNDVLGLVSEYILPKIGVLPLWAEKLFREKLEAVKNILEDQKEDDIIYKIMYPNYDLYQDIKSIMGKGSLQTIEFFYSTILELFGESVFKRIIKETDFYGMSINPNAIPILRRNPDRINWRNLCRNPSPDAISILEKNLDKIDWDMLSSNPSAIRILEKNLDNVNWICLSGNPSAIPLLEQNMDKVNWFHLSCNPSAISILEKNLDKINWNMLASCNPNPVGILKNNLDKIRWSFLCSNSGALPILEENLDKIKWSSLSSNKSAIAMLEKNLDKINWKNLCRNTNPRAIMILEKNPDKIDWKILSGNSSAISLIEKNVPMVSPYWRQLASNPGLYSDDQLATSLRRKSFVEKLLSL